MAAVAACLVVGCADSAPDAEPAVPESSAANVVTPAPLPGLSGQVILTGCRQGQCAWSRVVRVERVRELADGELRRLVARRGVSLHGFDEEPPSQFDEEIDVDWEPQDSAAYALCSTARPSYAFEDEGGLILHRLDLYDFAGYETSSARMYMRLCHGRDFPFESEPALAELGYRPGTPNGQVEAATADEILR